MGAEPTIARIAAAKASASMAATAISASHAAAQISASTAASAIPAFHAAARAFVNMAFNAISAADAVGRAFVSIGPSATCAAFAAPILLSAGATFLATAAPQQHRRRLCARRLLMPMYRAVKSCRTDNTDLLTSPKAC